MMQISQVGINLIKSFEGCRLSAYRDVAGKWTIGYGHTSGVYGGQTITQQQADSWLFSDIQKFVNGVNDNVHVPLNQYQFDALVSFAYNVGVTAFKTSTLVQLLNSGNYNGAANELDKWIHAGGRVVQGLVRRRSAEKSLFLKAVQSPPINTPVYHTVVRGDVLSIIAKNNGTTVSNIMSLNPNIKDADKIYVGQKIRIR